MWQQEQPWRSVGSGFIFSEGSAHVRILTLRLGVVEHERGMLWQEDRGFKASLGYIAKSYIKNKSQHQ